MPRRKKAISLSAESCNGLEFTFVDEVHPRFMCTICTKVMQDPHLMICCGQKYCHSCLTRWFGRKRVKSCPHCRATNCQSVLEKGMKSEIESFKINCRNYKLGCKWKGDLSSLPHHLGYCRYQEVECPKKCVSMEGFGTTKIIRKILKKHLAEYCVMRKYKCPDCRQGILVKDLSDHKAVCKMQSVTCPNGCEASRLVRQNLQTHLTKCPLQFVPCSRASEGCKETFPRQFLKEHLKIDCEYRLVECDHCNLFFPAKLLSNHLAECEVHPVSCPNNCGESDITRRTLEYHLKECQLQEIPCEHAREGCKEMVRRQSMKEHLESRCIFRSIKCQYCGKACATYLFSLHSSLCEMRPVSCPYKCGTCGIVRGTMSNHLQVCLQADVHCEYFRHGCFMELKRGELSEHLIDHQSEHLDLMKEAYSTTEAKMREAERVNKKIRKIILKELAMRKRNNAPAQLELLKILKTIDECF